MAKAQIKSFMIWVFRNGEFAGWKGTLYAKRADAEKMLFNQKDNPSMEEKVVQVKIRRC